MTRRVQLRGIGVAAPGLDGWAAGREVLRDPAARYRNVPLTAVIPTSLSPNERRRTSSTVRHALKAAEDAFDGSELRPDEVSAVFSSVTGEMGIADKICRTLSNPEPAVSPTLFHNSVHNAASGYWSIATGGRFPSTSIAVYGAGFAGGLLEAVVTVQAEGRPVLLVAYDVPGPHPLGTLEPLSGPFAVAMLLTADAAAETTASLTLELLTEVNPQTLEHRELEALRRGNPAAHSLPLLIALAQRRPGRVLLPYLPPATLAVVHEPA